MLQIKSEIHTEVTKTQTQISKTHTQIPKTEIKLEPYNPSVIDGSSVISVIDGSSVIDTLTTDTNMLIPLDGKTSIDSPQLILHISAFYDEMKLELEKIYQSQLIIQQNEILKTIAILLQSNYPNTYEKHEQYLDSIIAKINDNLKDKPKKKGRPKRKDNPWLKGNHDSSYNPLPLEQPIL